MTKLTSFFLAAVAALSFAACGGAAPTPVTGDTTQDIRVYTAPNPDGKITPATIEKAFETTGFSIDGNNNMNKPFSKRFGKTWYTTYHLATVHQQDITARLA